MFEAGLPVTPRMGSTIRTIGARTFDFTRQVATMAIVNRTVDSFYDRGRTFELDKAVRAAEAALHDGADWVDIGAVPFSPISAAVTEDEELDRLLPLVRKLRQGTDAVISVDTFRVAVAREALAAGADAINDTSGLYDARMADVAAQAGATLIITHSKAPPRTHLPRPQYGDVVDEVADFLTDRANLARDHGVAEDRIVIDPGHDLNKNTYHSLELTRRLGELAVLGYPLLAAISNKDFIAETLDRPPTDLIEGTLATLVVCVLQGARIVRVHNVKAMVPAIRTAEAMLA